MNSVLDNIRVLECAGGINGPSTGCMLGVLGAEVIKIEQPGRGAWERGIDAVGGTGLVLPHGLSIAMEVFNHSKKSITLDLSNKRGQEILHQLSAKSDVFITNYDKGGAKKLAVDYKSLGKNNPRLIYASTSALGGRGPESERRAFDFTGQARSGMMTTMGEDTEEPAIMVGAPIDQLGAIMLAYGVLAAIIAREKTGYGQEVETSMMGAAIFMQAFHVGISLLRQRSLSRHSRLKTRSPLSNYYKCSDGNWLVLTETQVPLFWENFCHALGLKELVDDDRFKDVKAIRKNADSLISILDKVFATKDRDEWIKILDEEVGIACSPIYSISDLKNDPQVLENDYIIDFDHPVLGSIQLPFLPIKFSKTPAKLNYRAPELGEHTEEILINVCGFNWKEISELKDQGII